MWVDIANLMGPQGADGADGKRGEPGPVNIGLDPDAPIGWDQSGGFTFNFVDGSEQTVNLPIASAQSAGLLGASGALPSTGRRDISASVVNASGQVYVERRGVIVELNLYGVTVSGEPTSTLTDLFGSSGIPLGFRPVQSFSAPLTVASSVPEPFPSRVFMNSSGACRVSNPGRALYGLVHFMTSDSWPMQ